MSTSPDQPHAPHPDQIDRRATCPDEILLAGWCDGLLDDRERELIDLHVAGCPRCVELVAGLRSELDASVDAARPFTPQLTIDRAAALVLTPRSTRSWRFIAVRAAAIAAAVALVPLGMWMGRSLSAAYTSNRSLEGRGSAVATGDDTATDLASRFASLEGGYEESSSDPFELIGLQLTDRSAS